MWRTEQGLSALGDNNPDALMRLDRDLHYLYVNATISAMSGYPREFFIGKTVSEAGTPQEVVDSWTETVGRVFSTGQMAAMEFEYSAPGGTTNWEARVIPEFGADGTVQSVCCIMRDVTEQRRTARALREMYDRFFLALESTGLGTFETDNPSGKVTLSDIAMGQLGLEGGPTFDLEFLLERIHPEDQEWVMELVKPTGTRCTQMVTPFAFDYRGIRTDGRERWFSIWGKLFADTEGRPVRTLGVQLDITERKRLEATVRERDEMSAALFDAAGQSIVAVDAQGTIQFVNKMATEVFGYERAELLGKSLQILIPEPARGRYAEREKKLFAHAENWVMGIGLDLEAQRKDGTRFPVEVALSVVQSLAGRLVVAFVSDITQRKQAEEVARKHAEEVQALAGSLLRAQEEERRRVSRELHDEICQQLAALTIDLGALAHEPLSKNGFRLLKDLQWRLVKASEKTRHIAYELHPSILEDLGLETALRDLCIQFSAQTKNIELDFQDIQLSEKVSLSVASCIYRIAQESLSNIGKHAGAKRVSVTLRMGDGKITLTIQDNGRGFNKEAARGRGGLGLIGMEERVRLEGGTLRIASRPNRGARIRVRLPLGHGLYGENVK
jgi:PAS domain S-box-containing protein